MPAIAKIVKKENMKTTLFLMICLVVTSCTSLSGHQKRELAEYKAKNLAVEEKSPATAAVLNILPGFGDFYNGNVGIGIVNLLFWPASVLWAPVGGATGADEVNYYTSKSHIEKLENKKKQVKLTVEEAFISERITKQQFYFTNKKIEMMHLSEFEREIDISTLMNFNEDAIERTPSSKKK